MQVPTKTTLHIGFFCELFLTDWSGIERLFANLAAAMLARGHRATLIVRPCVGQVSPKMPLTPIPEGCEVAELDWRSKPDETRDALRTLDFNVVLAPCSGADFLQFPVLLRGTGIPFICAESIHPTVVTHERWNPYEHYASLTACDRIQVLLDPYVAHYPKALRGRMDVIGNPAPPPVATDWAARANKPRRTLLSVGRFDEVDKQYTLLLRTWHLLAPEFPNWSLTLVGDGSGWDLYHAIVKAMGADARVTFTGSVADPSPFYADADLFCMPSRQESFGLVLGEAAAHGLPLVGLRSCEPARLFIDKTRGAVAETASPAALAAALRPLMVASPEERQRLGTAAGVFFQEAFSPTQVFDRWETAFARAATAWGNTRLDRLERDRWNAVLLREAALEVISRPEGTEGTASDVAAMARLRTAHQTLQKEHRALQKQYETLQRRLQNGGKR